MTAIENTIQLENAPAIEGLRFRLFAGASDYPHMAGIANAYAEWRCLPFQTSVEELTNDFDHDDNIDTRRDILFAEVNGEPVGYVGVFHFVNDDREQIFVHNGNLLPAFADAGLWPALVAWAEKRAGEIAQAEPHDGERFLQTFAPEAMQDKIATAEQFGYARVRYGFMMVRPLDEPIPNLPLPAGVEIRPKQREHYRATWEARNEAFRDHWGHHEQTEVDWQGYQTWPDHQPELCQVAWDVAKNEVAGEVNVTIYQRDNEAFGIKRGWTDPIFVRRPWRKQGLAKALIARAMQVLKDAGMNEAALGVDAQNPNGALKLYESLGFRVSFRTFTYRKAF
jgi:GNAT superfamily N-acetyltransferase